MNLAVFDLDKTLMPLNCERAWEEYVATQSGIEAAPVLKEIDAIYAAHARGDLDFDVFTSFSMRFLARFKRAYLDIYLDQYLKKWIEPNVTVKARALIDSHKKAGDVLTLCTAAYSYLSAPIAALLGIPNLLSSVPEENGEGEFTGKLDGPHNFGDEKVKRVVNFIKIQKMLCGKTIDKVTFYSDSIQDKPLFEYVERIGGTCVATNPDAKLLALAQEKGWKVLMLFDEEDYRRAKAPLVV